VAAFVSRHFGQEVTATIAGPLLAAVFGGDITQLSVRAVMPAFVRMEAEEGSLILALERRAPQSAQSLFTTLSTGLGTLVDRIVDRLPAASLRLNEAVLRIEADNGGWRLITPSGSARFDAVVLATPPHVTRGLLQDQQARMADLLPTQASSAIVVALAFTAEQASGLSIPRGFGFIVPPDVTSHEPELLACTFVDQKFHGRVSPGAVLLRAFFGGHAGDALLGESDEQITARARQQLARVLGPLPQATETVVRRWPRSLPQYAVGHLERMAELESLLRAKPGLSLVGSAYYGVGLPDLIRHGRATARLLARQPNTLAI
jgi:oxygen-dependent protoporphyrinogen oxidase